MLTALDLIGIFVFALSGASLAVRKQLDVVGAVSLALATGLAGGILRDLFLGDTPPAAFRDQWYLLVPIAATALTIAIPRIPRLLRRPDRREHRLVRIGDRDGSRPGIDLDRLPELVGLPHLLDAR